MKYLDKTKFQAMDISTTTPHPSKKNPKKQKKQKKPLWLEHGKQRSVVQNKIIVWQALDHVDTTNFQAQCYVLG